MSPHIDWQVLLQFCNDCTAHLHIYGIYPSHEVLVYRHFWLCFGITFIEGSALFTLTFFNGRSNEINGPVTSYVDVTFIKTYGTVVCVQVVSLISSQLPPMRVMEFSELRCTMISQKIKWRSAS